MGLAMHATLGGSDQRKITIDGSTVWNLDTQGPYTLSTAGAHSIVLNQPMLITETARGGDGAAGGYGPGTPGASGTATTFDGLSGAGGAGGSSGTVYYTGRTVTEGPAFDNNVAFNYGYNTNNGQWAWAGVVRGGFYNGITPGDGWNYYDGGSDGGGGVHNIYRQTTVYDVANYTFGGAGSPGTQVSSGLVTRSGTLTCNIGSGANAKITIT